MNTADAFVPPDSYAQRQCAVGSLALEKRDVRLGYMALTDCAPLVVAQQLGFFQQHGLTVTLSREASWATLRDKLLTGLIDGAQLLAPLPILQTLTQPQAAIVTALMLSRNGNALTVSRQLFDDWSGYVDHSVSLPLMAPEPLAEFVRFVTKEGVFRLGIVHQHACHHYQVMDWLAVLPLELRRKCQVIVIPPVAMVDALADGHVQGFCVGAPWNAVAVRRSVGVTVATSLDIWGDHPEKVLGVCASWHHSHPNTHAALLSAIVQAQQWLKDSANRFEAACWLSRPEFLGAPVDVIAPALLNHCLTHPQLPVRTVTDYLQFNPSENQSLIADGHWLLDKVMLYSDNRLGPVATTLIENIYLTHFREQATAHLLPVS